MRRAFVFVLACIVLLSTMALAQTRRRTSKHSTPKRSAPTSTFAEKQAAEIQAGRAQVATQIKTLTQFLYLLGGISKTIETAEQASRNREQPTLSPEQIGQTKAKVKESIKSVRAGLAELERSFRFNPVLTTYYPNLSGVALIGETAENQATSGRIDEAGRSLIKAVNKLTDALATMR